jgi:phosphonoacetaldehyde hydrolase
LIADPAVAKAWSERFGRAATEVDIDRIYAAVEPLMLAEAARHSTLIPGAADVVDWLQHRGVKIGSSTGYTRAMMAGILPRAAEQGYAPSVVVCAGETRLGRPSPLPMWKVLSELAAYPAWHTVKVDDAVVGIEEGRAAGAWTIGIAASGNGVGLGLEDWRGLSEAERKKRSDASAQVLRDTGADYVIATIADSKDVFAEIERRIARGERPRV